MDHGGESPRTATAESIELGMPGIVQGADAGINADMFDSPGAPYRNSAELAGHVRTGAEVLVAVFRPGETGPGVVHAHDVLQDPVDAADDNYGYYALQPRQGAGRGEMLVGLLPDGVGRVSSNYGGFAGIQRAELLVVGLRADGVAGVSGNHRGFAGAHAAQRAELLVFGLRPDDGVSGVSGSYGGFTGAQRAELLVVGLWQDSVVEVSSNYGGFGGAQRGEVLLRLRPDGVGGVSSNYGSFVGAQRGEVLVGLRSNGVGGAVYRNYGDSTHLTLAGTGRAAGIIGELHASNLGLAYDSSSAELAYDSLSTVRIRRLLPVAGVLASSAAVTGLSAGAVTPAAGLGSFALLLAGLAMIMIHVLLV